MTPLRIDDHARDSAGMTYVYPVISRRAGGVSLGINLNPNNACNWRCIYCQVPDLSRGGPPPIDLALLAQELGQMLDDILQGDFMARRVPADARRLMDIAFSGNGEPTSAPEFSRAVTVVGQVLAQRQLQGTLPNRLITNGSLLGRKAVQEGVTKLAQLGGEVWFKLDRATPAGMAQVNSVSASPAVTLRRLRACAGLCPTWVQTCLFELDGRPPDAAEVDAYVELLTKAADVIAGVHLYGLARPSLQPEAPRLARVAEGWLEALAERLRARGLEVRLSP